MMSLDFLRNKVYKVDGVTLTVGGLLLVLLVGYLIWRARR